MKKTKALIALFLMMAVLSGCGKQSAKGNDADGKDSLTGMDTSTLETSSIVDTNESESNPDEDLITIYILTEDRKALEETQVPFRLQNDSGEAYEETVDASFVLEQLKRFDLVPRNTSILTANIKDEDDQTILYLSLSSDYKDMILELPSMETELLYIAALTNSMIENLYVDALRLSIEGGNLITEHKVYNTPLTFYDPEYIDSVWEGYQYELTEESYINENGTFSATYPHFANMEDVAMMELFNQKIDDLISNRKRLHTDGTEMLHYEVAYQDGNFVSLLFKGEVHPADGSNASRYLVTLNLDLETGSNRRLKDYVDIAHVIDCLELSTGYEVVGEAQVTKEEFADFITTGGIEDFAFLLLDYDMDLNNASFVPAGYTYLSEDEKTVIVMTVPNRMGDYVEIQIN